MCSGWKFSWLVDVSLVDHHDEMMTAAYVSTLQIFSNFFLVVSNENTGKHHNHKATEAIVSQVDSQSNVRHAVHE